MNTSRSWLLEQLISLWNCSWLNVYDTTAFILFCFYYLFIFFTPLFIFGQYLIYPLRCSSRSSVTNTALVTHHTVPCTFPFPVLASFLPLSLQPALEIKECCLIYVGKVIETSFFCLLNWWANFVLTLRFFTGVLCLASWLWVFVSRSEIQWSLLLPGLDRGGTDYDNYQFCDWKSYSVSLNFTYFLSVKL